MRLSCGEPFPVYTRFVHRFFTPLLRRLYGFLAAFVIVYAAFHFAQYTRWNKERLYRKLLAGDRRQKLTAAFDLAWLGGQENVLDTLKSTLAPFCEIAGDSLLYLSVHPAGQEWFSRAPKRAID